MVMISSSEYFANRSCQNMISFVLNPRIEMVWLPLSLNSRRIGYTGATPNPPPTNTTVARDSMCDASPSGPTRSRM
ncbi:hypothetical protein MBAV_004250 [Candidatus Magnetobacterium bavaricum]|uniref:Uncharacterized protein n=1 Tax=Candidatus Magnetobacterium bavaricum TaxID=29290 RepID=A0A0F3GNN9_9BACT|nr:hypothetical protein MBAV_004250 [Candidatus Magnetobacterium bavaricum]